MGIRARQRMHSAGQGGKGAADEGRCGVDEVHGGDEGDKTVLGIFLYRFWRMDGKS